MRSSAPLRLVVLLEHYFERELNFAFRLGGAGKEAEVGIRDRVVASSTSPEANRS